MRLSQEGVDGGHGGGVKTLGGNLALSASGVVLHLGCWDESGRAKKGEQGPHVDVT